MQATQVVEFEHQLAGVACTARAWAKVPVTPSAEQRRDLKARIRRLLKERNAVLLRDVLQGEKGARRSAVLLNAGAAIAAAEVCETIREGVRLAEDAIDSGAALDRLDQFVRTSLAHKATGSAA